jgi:hypothetical protein
VICLLGPSTTTKYCLASFHCTIPILHYPDSDSSFFLLSGIQNPTRAGSIHLPTMMTMNNHMMPLSNPSRTMYLYIAFFSPRDSLYLSLDFFISLLEMVFLFFVYMCVHGIDLNYTCGRYYPPGPVN